MHIVDQSYEKGLTTRQKGTDYRIFFYSFKADMDFCCSSLRDGIDYRVDHVKTNNSGFEKFTRLLKLTKLQFQQVCENGCIEDLCNKLIDENIVFCIGPLETIQLMMNFQNAREYIENELSFEKEKVA